MDTSSTDQTLTIHSQGIYHGLPDLSNAPKGLTAIVTGANGISGAHMVNNPPHQLTPSPTHTLSAAPSQHINNTHARTYPPCRRPQIRVLAQSPQRWTKIYALSRRPPSGHWPDQVEHIPLDFLSPPKEIAHVLKQREIVGPVYVFWFAYILVTDESGALQWSDKRLIDQNSK